MLEAITRPFLKTPGILDCKNTVLKVRSMFPSLMNLCRMISLEVVAIGRTFAGMKDYQLDGNKEMVALGSMNMVIKQHSIHGTSV
ncbi:putative SLC26A/SulP transporter [Helianthus annuus]|uniref:SLC26A/SulP transporter n=1 Tax=Helianthus annuus TaxID=4232 RepID=A0A251VG71_HELAN|nr:putative SLC26A/SulP transporter [Helianthus annuus]KAJ0627125.1 putative SLC26A/SulP transporter [Helianthus annuus]KAJ0783438.1 putative SLC26A/SulP transporter [Helianthus annuus]